MPTVNSGIPVPSQPFGVVSDLPQNTSRLSLVGIMKDGTQATAEQLSAVAWSSSDPTIAEVRGGYIYPQKNGTVTITATVNNISTSAIIIIGDIELNRIVTSKPSAVLAVGNVMDINKI